MAESDSSKPSISKLEENLTPEINKLNDFNVSPFTLKWAVGMNVDVAIVNLTTKNRDVIAYACSHVVILYDYVSRDMMSLQGHQNAVSSLSASRDGKWLLSADYGEDCVCIVWDTETRVPICSLFNPHGKNCLTAVELSPDAKYLVTVGNERLQVVNFWLWTNGNDEPDATVELRDTSADRVKKISFNDECPAEFILTLDHSVIFVFWKNSESLDMHRPTIPTKNRRAIENLRDSCYVSKTQLAMTVTNAGFVLIWSDFIKSEQSNSRKNKSDKRLVKAVSLQKGSLTSIENADEIITIGNDAGQLFFYDNRLKLLYWCDNCGFDSIVSISFDCKSDLKRPEIVASETTISECNDEIEDNMDSVDEEEESLNDSEPETTEDEETIIDEDSERNVVELEEELKNVDKCILKHENNSLKETKQLAASTTTVDIDYQLNGKGPTDCTIPAGKFVIPKFFVCEKMSYELIYEFKHFIQGDGDIN